MQKILLTSEASEMSCDTLESIETHLPYQIYTAYDPIEVDKQLESRVFNLIIIESKVFDFTEYKTILEYREDGLTSPILFVAEKLNIPQNYYMNESINLHFISKPYTEKNLLGIARKLLAQKTIPRQRYRRFNTNQIAQIETLSDGSNRLTSMYNLSKGGAYCEFEGGQQMSIGELVRLKIILSETNTEHSVNAKVVWTTARGRFSGRQGLGVRFLSVKDSYREMIEKL